MYVSILLLPLYLQRICSCLYTDTTFTRLKDFYTWQHRVHFFATVFFFLLNINILRFTCAKHVVMIYLFWLWHECPQFIYPFLCWKTFGYYYDLGIVNLVVTIIPGCICYPCIYTHVRISLGLIPWSGMDRFFFSPQIFLFSWRDYVDINCCSLKVCKQ